MTQTAVRFSFETSDKSDVGMVRQVNEDSVLVDKTSNVWVVADGMGGHEGGDFASQKIVGHLSTIGIPASAEDLVQRFKHRLNDANQAIMQRAEQLGRGSIGSTLAAVMAYENRFICFWSGDSRVYRLRGGSLRRVSKDHTEVQALIDAGTLTPEQATTWARRNVITQAIGVTQTLSFDVIEGRIEDGDIFLICSDGLTEYFMDAEIEATLNTEDRSLDDLCDHFVAQARDRGGKDNVSVVLVRAIAHPAEVEEIDGWYPEYRGLL